MACFHEVVENEADRDDLWQDDEGDKPESKHWFADFETVIFQAQQGVIDTQRLVSGFRPLQSSYDVNGTDDKRTPVDGGKPVVGNFLRAKKFDFRCVVRTGVYSVAPTTFANTTRNAISFRMIWMLVWLYPPISTNQNDEEEFFLNFFQLYSGGGFLNAYLQPEKKHQVKILYDCVHTLSSPKAPVRTQTVAVTAAAGGQAGYVVPAPSGTLGWVVPAATVPAVASAVTTELRDVYGGHQCFINDTIDLSGLNVSLWRDPFSESPQQMVPYLQCFVCTDAIFAYVNDSGLERDWNVICDFQTAFEFADE